VDLIKAGLGFTRAPEVDGLTRDDQLVEQVRPLGDFLYDHYWRVRVEGASQLPTGPFLVVANHAGVLPVDGPVLHAALKRERPDLPDARWLVEDAVYHAAFLGPLLHRLGALRASPDNALRVLRDGRPLIVFPEGDLGSGKPFSERYQLQRLGRGGFVKVALEAGVPIVPAAIVGSEETSPLLARIPAKAVGLPWLPLAGPLPLPARWHIRFAAPLLPSELGTDSEPLASRVERGTEFTRATLQGMLDDLVAQRSTPFS
jgi:1-acyl-sn-glycerol-3-phosphate acyltransferase